MAVGCLGTQQIGQDTHTLAGITLTGFETLATESSGTLTLTGNYGYDQLLSNGDLTIATTASLTARKLRFWGADNRLTIAGEFTGVGNDVIAVSGGSANAPVAFSTIANVETLASSAVLGNADMTGGRFVGLAGSSLRADRISVAQSATFGSAGTVTSSLTVAGDDDG